MRRALLSGFFLGPLPFTVWSALLLRRSAPDPIAMNVIGLAITLPFVWFLSRKARRPMYLATWASVPGILFYAAIRRSIMEGFSGSGALGVLLFPITGYHVLDHDGAILMVACTLVFGIIAGFASIHRRAVPPSEEQDEKPAKRLPEEDAPTPPGGTPQYVMRPPPPKPKGPALTPKQRPTPPPRQTRVPGA